MCVCEVRTTRSSLVPRALWHVAYCPSSSNSSNRPALSVLASGWQICSLTVSIIKPPRNVNVGSCEAYLVHWNLVTLFSEYTDISAQSCCQITLFISYIWKWKNTLMQNYMRWTILSLQEWSFLTVACYIMRFAVNVNDKKDETQVNNKQVKNMMQHSKQSIQL